MDRRLISALLLLAALATPTLGFSFLIGTLRCIGGPAEWCRDVESAKRCGKEQFCQEKVWKSEAETAHNTRKNDAGEVIFSSIDSRPFETMEKIMDMQMKEMEGIMSSFVNGRDEVFDRNGIFDGFFGRKNEKNDVSDDPFDGNPFDDFFNKQHFIKSAVDNNNNNRVNSINNLFNLNNIIGNIFGNGKKDENQDKPEATPNTEEAFQTENDDVCGACINITTQIRDEFLTKANEEEVLSALEGLCKKLGPVEGICDEAVKSYVPKYFAMARNFLNNPKLLCEFAGLCKVGAALQSEDTEFPSFKMAPSSYKVSAQSCSLCSNVAQGLKSVLKMPGFAENFPSTICDLLHESGDQECLEFMESFVALFHEQIDPAIICASSFCPNSGVDDILDNAEDQLLLQRLNNYEELTTQPPNTTTPPPPPPKPLPRICKKCIHHLRISIHFMEKKIWRERRRWLWGCKYALNKTQCVEAINNFVDKAEGRLKKMCPHKICSKTGFCPPVNCTSSDTPHNHVEVESSSPSSSSISLESVPMIKLEPAAKQDEKCIYCEEAVNYIKILLGNKESQAEIKELVIGMCSQAGPFKVMCTEFVDKHLDELVEKLSHMDTKQACVSLHLCQGSASFQNFISTVTASAPCSSCKYVVKSVVLPQITALGSEHDFAIGLCHTIGQDDLLCHKHISNFLTIAKSQFSLKGMESLQDNVCKPFCQSEMKSIFDRCHLDRDADVPLTTTEAPTTTVAPTTPPAPTPPPQPPVCKRCIKVIGMIKEQLTKRLSCLESRLTASCRLVPPVKAECEAAVTAFFTPLKQKIAKVEPMAVCVKAGVCNPAKEGFSFSNLPIMSLTPIRNLGYTGGRAKQLSDLFGGIGPVLPAPDQFPDLSFLDRKDPQAKSELKSESALTDDKKIRISRKKSFIPLSPSVHRDNAASSGQVLKMDASPKVGQDAACTVCTYLVDDLKEHWSNEAKEELKALMMAGCTKLPVKQRDECMEFMAPKMDSFVKLSVQIPTKEICQIIKVCQSESVLALSAKLPADSMQCYACKFAGEELKEVWSNPNVPSTINTTLHSICLKLPVDYQLQCHEVIDQTFPEIDGMVKDMDPGAVCESLGVCEAEKRHLLGSDDCTWHLTPEILCADWKRAKKCGKIDLCKEQVWGMN